MSVPGEWVQCSDSPTGARWPAAHRNATVIHEEISIIEEIAEAFKLPLDRSRLISETNQVTPTPGMRACFTGSPPSDVEQAHLSKENVRQAATSAGLEETATVTKTKCELLENWCQHRADSESESGPARTSNLPSRFGRSGWIPARTIIIVTSPNNRGRQRLRTDSGTV